MSENTWIMDGLEWDNPLRIRLLGSQRYSDETYL